MKPKTATRSAALAAVLLLPVTLLLNGCATVNGHVQTPPAEITVTDALRQLLAQNPRPAILLRVPETSGSLTGSETILSPDSVREKWRTQTDQTSWGQGIGGGRGLHGHSGALAGGIGIGETFSEATTSRAYSEVLRNQKSLYSTLERTLLKAGFTVRDRNSLNIVTRGKNFIDYESIGRETKTDVFIEIIDFQQNVPHALDKWYDADGNLFTRKDGEKFRVMANHLVLRLVLAKDGAIGAMLELSHFPDDIKVIHKPSTDSYLIPSATIKPDGSEKPQTSSTWRNFEANSTTPYSQRTGQFLQIAESSAKRLVPAPSFPDSAAYFSRELLRALKNP
ncbi:MAG: hypothetical protein LBR12_00630 [Opitutaceae bacterium]|jgi:hypothetical protein|nr:hypothetical protein [Opitutaceae bacterium]